MAARRSPLSSLTALVFTALLALSLVVTTAQALAATPHIIDGRSDTQAEELREFFHGRGLLGITWESFRQP